MPVAQAVAIASGPARTGRRRQTADPTKLPTTAAARTASKAIVAAGSRSIGRQSIGGDWRPLFASADAGGARFSERATGMLVTAASPIAIRIAGHEHAASSRRLI